MWCERAGAAAFAGWAALVAIVGCNDAPPKPRTAAASATPASATIAPSVASSVGDAVKIDRPPYTVAPEQRLRQQQRGKWLVIDTKGTWAPECAIHRACAVAPKALELCAPELDAEAWGTLAGKAEHFTDPQVAVNGQLMMADSAFSTAVGCKPGQCCNGRRAKMVLAGPPYDLELAGLGCDGDESRLCCALSARGEQVIARGRLTYSTGRLRLQSPELCRTNTD
jgi:hypothetical protein